MEVTSCCAWWSIGHTWTSSIWNGIFQYRGGRPRVWGNVTESSTDESRLWICTCQIGQQNQSQWGSASDLTFSKKTVVVTNGLLILLLSAWGWA